MKRTQSDKVLRDKTFNIASDPKYDGYQRGLASMVYKFFDKKSSGSGITNKSNYQLANELHKPIIKKFKKIYYVQSICLVNMHGLFLQKVKKELVFLMHFKK